MTKNLLTEYNVVDVFCAFYNGIKVKRRVILAHWRRELLRRLAKVSYSASNFYVSRENLSVIKRNFPLSFIYKRRLKATSRNFPTNGANVTLNGFPGGVPNKVYCGEAPPRGINFYIPLMTQK